MSLRRAVFLSVLALSCLVAAAPVTRDGSTSKPGADVHIAFSGLICHVFDQAHPPRAVVMRGNEAMPHRATLYISQSAIASSDIFLTCEGGECTLDLTNVAMRFRSAGAPQIDQDGSFDRLVPHLRPVTNGEMAELRSDVFDEVPSPASPVSASFELPSGRMSAVAYGENGRYEPDFEQRGVRQFAREVFLDGHVASPTLLIRNAADTAMALT